MEVSDIAHFLITLSFSSYNKKNLIPREIELAKESLQSAEILAKSKEEEYSRQTASVAGLLATAALLSESRSVEDEEISRLEALLTLAKEKNRNTVIKQTTLDINISAETRTKEVR